MFLDENVTNGTPTGFCRACAIDRRDEACLVSTNFLTNHLSHHLPLFKKSNDLPFLVYRVTLSFGDCAGQK
jgi:hypothetical protein